MGGSLEVRTTQMHDGAEIVGMMFSVREGLPRSSHTEIQGSEKVVKVTVYVKAMHSEPQEGTAPRFTYYAVLATESGSIIVTEQVKDVVTWDENVEDLADCNSLAKLICIVPCHGEGIRVRDLRRSCQLSSSTCCSSQAYVMSLCTQALGGLDAVLKAVENSAKEWDARKASNVEEEVSEQRLSDHVSASSGGKLSPCSRCEESLSAGFKSADGSWLCSPCWNKEGGR